MEDFSVLQVQEEQVSVLFFFLSLSLSPKLSFPLGSFSSVCPDFSPLFGYGRPPGATLGSVESQCVDGTAWSVFSVL